MINSIRKWIIFHHKSGKSIRNISKLVNLSHSTVQYVIKPFKEEIRIVNKVRKGQPWNLTKRDDRFTIRKFRKNAHLSAVKVSAQINETFSSSISPETVRRILREAGLHGRSARKKLFVSAKNRNLRLSFSKSMINKPETCWNNAYLLMEANLTFLAPMAE